MSGASRPADIHRKACEFILSQDIRCLPIQPAALIEKNRWGLVTYRRLAELGNVKAVDVPSLVGSEDGFTIWNGRNYCIAYNDAVEVYGRVLFTLLHEIGHIVLGHFQMENGDRLHHIGDSRFEIEAGLFAAEVIAPAAVVTRCGFLTAGSLHCACGLSLEAAENRLLQLAHWVPDRYDEAVGRAMGDYIRQTSLRRHKSAAAEICCD